MKAYYEIELSRDVEKNLKSKKKISRERSKNNFLFVQEKT